MGARRLKRPSGVTLYGITFIPVMAETDRDPCTGTRRLVPVTINGKKLYAIPGRLMAYEEDLPAIALRITKSSGESKPTR
jgi:hypothetical protein